MADYYTQFSAELPLAGPEQIRAAQEILGRWDSGDLEETGDEPRDFCVDFMDDEGAPAAWIHDIAGDGSPNQVILFVQMLAERAPTQGRWGFTWAFTCSKPRLDSFGGGAAVIDRTTGDCWTIDAHDWMSSAIDSPMLPGEPLRPVVPR